MRFAFSLNKPKRKILFYSALIFLLQSIAPAFQGVMARTVIGYTDTICTMYGPKTIFVVLDDEQSQSDPKCWECSVCVLQANLNGQPEPSTSLIETRFLEDIGQLVELLYTAPDPVFFPRFLSRAPPA
jgi:hypothetical protein